MLISKQLGIYNLVSNLVRTKLSVIPSVDLLALGCKLLVSYMMYKLFVLVMWLIWRV